MNNAKINALYLKIKQEYKTTQPQAENLLSYCGYFDGIAKAAKANQLTRIPLIGIKTQNKIKQIIK